MFTHMSHMNVNLIIISWSARIWGFFGISNWHHERASWRFVCVLCEQIDKSLPVIHTHTHTQRCVRLEFDRICLLSSIIYAIIWSFFTHHFLAQNTIGNIVIIIELAKYFSWKCLANENDFSHTFHKKNDSMQLPVKMNAQRKTKNCLSLSIIAF